MPKNPISSFLIFARFSLSGKPEGAAINHADPPIGLWNGLS
jgi:hypothetical protein